MKSNSTVTVPLAVHKEREFILLCVCVYIVPLLLYPVIMFTHSYHPVYQVTILHFHLLCIGVGKGGGGGGGATGPPNVWIGGAWPPQYVP